MKHDLELNSAQRPLIYSLGFEGTEELPQPQVTLDGEQHGGGVRTSGRLAASPFTDSSPQSVVPWPPNPASQPHDETLRQAVSIHQTLA